MVSGWCLGGVWRLSGGVWVVSGECLGASGGVWGVLDGVWMVFETLFPIRALCAPPRDIRKSRTPCLIGLSLDVFGLKMGIPDKIFLFATLLVLLYHVLICDIHDSLFYTQLA